MEENHTKNSSDLGLAKYQYKNCSTWSLKVPVWNKNHYELHYNNNYNLNEDKKSVCVILDKNSNFIHYCWLSSESIHTHSSNSSKVSPP